MVNASFRMNLRRIATKSLYELGSAIPETVLRHDVFISDRAAFIDASDLLDSHGEFAAVEAAQRASRSRDLGNVVHFCRWREVARMIDMLSDHQVGGALH
jgi:hypothetical protein